MRVPLPIGLVNWNESKNRPEYGEKLLTQDGSIFITTGDIQVITFKIIATQSETEALKTRTHHKTYSVHECCQSQRIGYVMESVQTFNLEGSLIKSSQSIKSYYFGFPNSSQADKFADFAKYKFPLLDKYGTNCESRLSKRLKSPFEVKIRNLSTLKDELATFFGQCIDKELNSAKVVEMPVAEVKRKLARL